MADGNETPNRVKRLFSSFLSSVCQPSTENTQITCKESKSKSVEGRVTESSVPDSRNRQLFYKRVYTFSPLTWFAKPLELSPLVCARYGWENVNSDMLQCVNCKAFLCGRLPKGVDTLVYRECCNKLKKSLIDSHEKLCKWSSSPCPESFQYVPYHDREELLNNFWFRVTSLQCARIPSISYTSMEEKGVSEETMLAYTKSIQLNSTDERDAPASVIVCALCGWLYSESQVGILQCNICCRKIGLWNYKFESANEKTQQLQTSPSTLASTEKTRETGKSLEQKINGGDSADTQNGIHKEDSENSKDNQNTEHINGNSAETSEINDAGNTRESASMKDACEEPASKRPRLEKQTFDPIAEHRYWCPWLQSGSLNLTVREARSQDTSPVVSPVKSPSATPISPDHVDPTWLLVTKILCHNAEDEDDFCRQMKQSPQVEGLRHLRKVLRQCTSPTSPTKLPQP
ncbi:zinc finger C3HC-type protein 1-like [Mercenaria mercenaria]|uniref:zinc finger C3HC-type protein 1-like n=1 Tax=Mercenaria mercenaria TaxID=6596 RepID=UPI00234F85DA|nr:zinc finger C3HC-type protein 1-like [Mercenaria mercenaria]